MTYILLVAGRGSRLFPLTLKQPKSLYKLDGDTTVLQRMVRLIKKNDANATIVIVTGFMHETIEKEVKGVIFINNPFYGVTNSIASLWFARDYMDADNVCIINGDIVMEEKLMEQIICKQVIRPEILYDSSIRSNGDYNVQINNDTVLVMSKELDQYDGEYAGVTKLDRDSALRLRSVVENMVHEEMYDQWYENALVQMIFNYDFKLYYEDICNYKWTEVDCVSDMLLAKTIHLEEMQEK